jgi:hypothetical protein
MPLFSRIVQPRYPSTALGLERGGASVVHLERGRGNTYTLRRAATVALSDSIVQPSFHERNIENQPELVAALNDLATSAGLIRQKRWSISLPEATTRTLVVTIETPASTNAELNEVLNWKMERGFGAPLEELSVSRQQLQRDAQGRDRYLATAIPKSVLAEYEQLFHAMGWRVGLILPRHVGEAQWLVRNGGAGDSLLLSASNDGFTAIIFRDKHPLILRNVICAQDEREDELYRLLLFYRDRRNTDAQDGTKLSRLMVVGDGFSRKRVGEIVNETTGGDLRPLQAEDLGLSLPDRDLSFDAIAAPAGLAILSF